MKYNEEINRYFELNIIINSQASKGLKDKAKKEQKQIYNKLISEVNDVFYVVKGVTTKRIPCGKLNSKYFIFNDLIITDSYFDTYRFYKVLENGKQVYASTEDDWNFYSMVRYNLGFKKNLNKLTNGNYTVELNDKNIIISSDRGSKTYKRSDYMVAYNELKYRLENPVTLTNKEYYDKMTRLYNNIDKYTEYIESYEQMKQARKANKAYGEAINKYINELVNYAEYIDGYYMIAKRKPNDINLYIRKSTFEAMSINGLSYEDFYTSDEAIKRGII